MGEIDAYKVPIAAGNLVANCEGPKARPTACAGGSQ
jgi:hypothetical protein